MRLSTRRRVSSPISVLPRRTFDTVTTETPRSRAISFNRTAIDAPRPSGSSHTPNDNFLLTETCPAPQTPAAGNETQQQHSSQSRNPAEIHRQRRQYCTQSEPYEHARCSQDDRVVPPAAALVPSAKLVATLCSQRAIVVETIAPALPQN